MNVTLTASELAIASLVGSLREISSRRRGAPNRHGFDGDSWGVHIEGAR